MVGRALRIAVAALGPALAGALASGAALAAGTPALVVDAESGRVLFAERATDPWFPASITKLMTTYVALDMVRQGKVSLSTPLTLSAEAAAEPPSKMGLRPGTQVTLDNALKIIMVKSANDMAMMIGENLGGSVDGFAVLMNQTAARLGMRESRWVNPNGLPDERQQTSARDMAILARALLRDFPEHEGLFHIGALKLGSQIIRNHNGLLGRYPGADGMKTGFICAGGFNVVASATQNGRRIITVVMGYGSARERDLRAADLFDEGFGKAGPLGGGWGAQRLEDLAPSSSLAPPNMRPIVCGPHKRQPEDDDEPALVARGPAGGNADNPIAALFQPSSFGNPGSAAGAPILGSRRTLGPRVAFEPIPIFIGPTQGSPQDGADATDRIRIAARPVKVKPLSRGAGVPLPATASAFVPTLRPTGTARIIETVTARPRGVGAPLAVDLDAKPFADTKPFVDMKPSADTKPRLGAVGSGPAGRPKLGAIPARPQGADGAAGLNPDAAAPKAAPAAAKPAGVKPAATRVVATKPAATKAAGTRTADGKPATARPAVKAKPSSDQ